MYLVMELVEGPTLRRLVGESALSVDRVVGLSRQLADGLSHAHSRGVVHRDLKPDNVLVVGDSARIADFGLAISVSSEDARLTTSGVFCTPLYAAPEQLLGKDIDHRVDLYALGATMFEMLTGLPPFQGDANQVMAKKLGCAAPKVGSLAPSTPPALAALVDRLLARKPGSRPQTAGEVIEKLDEIAAGTTPAWSRRRFAIALAAIASAFGFMEMPRSSRVETASSVQSTAAEDPMLPALEHVTAPISIVPEIIQQVPGVDDRGNSAIPMTLDDSGTLTATDHPQPPREVEAKGTAHAAPRILAAAHRPSASVIASSARHQMPHIVGLDVTGSLSQTAVRRAVDRIMPALRGCAPQVGERVVVASFAIGETRRASDLRISGRGSQCLASALSSVRTESVPDMGDVAVQIKIAF
jgi:hypothetical protein